MGMPPAIDIPQSNSQPSSLALAHDSCTLGQLLSISSGMRYFGGFCFFRLITWDGLLNVRITTRIITPHSERIPGGSKKEGQIGAHLCPSLLSCFSRTVVIYTIANKWAVEIGTLCSLTLEFFLRYILPFSL